METKKSKTQRRDTRICSAYSASGCLRGQAYTIEMFTVLIASIVILGAAMTLLGSINAYRTNTDKTLLTAQDAANALMLTVGFPSNWEQNVSLTSVAGIAYWRNVIDPVKLAMLNQTNYPALFGLERFNVSINVTSGGVSIYQTGTVDANSSIALVERTCVFTNGTPCMLRLMVSGG